MRRGYRSSLLITAIGIGTLAFAGHSFAAQSPADAIKYRKAVMAAMGGHTGAFTLINFGRVDQPAHLQLHVDALADLARIAKDVFPAGSGTGDTQALPLIWEPAEKERFDKLAATLEKSAADLRDATAAGNKAAAMTAFKAVGESCKGCHDRYRKETR